MLSNLSFSWLVLRLLLCDYRLTRFSLFFLNLLFRRVRFWRFRFSGVLLWFIWFPLSLNFFKFPFSDILQLLFTNSLFLLQFLISLVGRKSWLNEAGLLLQEFSLIINSHWSLTLHLLLHLSPGKLLFESHNTLQLLLLIALIFLRFVFFVIRWWKRVVRARALIFIIWIRIRYFDLLLLDIVIWLLIFRLRNDSLLVINLRALLIGLLILYLTIVAFVNDAATLDSAGWELLLTLNIITISIHSGARHLWRGLHHGLRLLNVWRESKVHWFASLLQSFTLLSFEIF